MMRRFGRINFWRRLVQAAAFGLLVYGAYIFPKPLETGLLPATAPPAGQPSTTRFAKGSILWATDDKPRIDSYPPSAVCRFNPKGGMFKACILHFLSENLTWATSFKHLLPHLVFFAALSFLFARLWCGWVCPLGSVGDFLCYLRKKAGLDHVKFSARAQRVLRIGNYSLLALALGLSILIIFPPLEVCKDALFLPYCQICPARLIFPAFGGTLPNLMDFSSAFYSVFTVLAWGLLGVFVLAFFTGKNIWCRLCPIGTFGSLFNRGGGTALLKDQSRCNSCGICLDCCPVGSPRIYEAKASGDVSHAECILCLRCVELCPKDDCLKFNLLGAGVARSRFDPGRIGREEASYQR